MRDVDNQQNLFDNANVWSTITSEIWAQQPQKPEDVPPSPAKPKPPLEAPAVSPSGPSDKAPAPSQPAPKDAGTAPKEKPQPKPPVEYPIPAPGGQPLGIDELIMGQKSSGSKAFGLGSEDYGEREAAEKALIGIGVKALPYIDRILLGKLSGKNDKLTPAEEAAREDPEIRQRLERIRQSIVTDLPRLMRDLASDDQTVSERAELTLRRMPIDKLVDRMAKQRDLLTDDQFKSLAKLVHPQVPERALMSAFGAKGDWSSDNLNSDELARSLVVYEILGKPLEPVQARLAYSLIKNGGAPELKKATELLKKLDGTPVDSDTAICRDVCHAVIAMRSGKAEDGLRSLEQIAESVEEPEQGNRRFYDGPPLAKVCEDLNRLVERGTIQLDDKQKQRLNALSAKTLEYRKGGIGELLKQLGK